MGNNLKTAKQLVNNKDIILRITENPLLPYRTYVLLAIFGLLTTFNTYVWRIFIFLLIATHFDYLLSCSNTTFSINMYLKSLIFNFCTSIFLIFKAALLDINQPIKLLISFRVRFIYFHLFRKIELLDEPKILACPFTKGAKSIR